MGGISTPWRLRRTGPTVFADRLSSGQTLAAATFATACGVCYVARQFYEPLATRLRYALHEALPLMEWEAANVNRQGRIHGHEATATVRRQDGATTHHLG